MKTTTITLLSILSIILLIRIDSLISDKYYYKTNYIRVTSENDSIIRFYDEMDKVMVKHLKIELNKSNKLNLIN